MTALLRSDDAAGVQTFAGPIAPVNPLPHPLEAECAQLRAEVDGLRAAASRARDDHAEALERAVERGRAEGLALAQARHGEKLAALESGLARASQLFEQKLAGTERFAAELASVAIERVVANPVALASSTTAFISRQVETLRTSVILRAHVSAADFPDDSMLAALRSALCSDGARIEIVRDAALPAGRARFDCTLGEAEADLSGQLQTLAAVLRDLAGG